MEVNWEGIVGGVILVIIMAMLVERAAAFIFDWRWWKRFHLFDLNGKGLKSVVVLGLSWIMCAAANFSILRMAFGADRGEAGTILTALVVAGGSKAAFDLFAQVAGLREQARGNPG